MFLGKAPLDWLAIGYHVLQLVMAMVGPCCIVGIPFGIWAIVVLLKPEVQQSFS